MIKLVESIEEANYWLAFGEQDEYFKKRLTKGKLYKLELIKTNTISFNGESFENEDYYIKDDTGQYSMLHTCCDGCYLKVL